MPSAVDVFGEVSFGSAGNSSTITANDFIVTTVHIDAPLTMRITESDIDIDIESQEIEQKDITDFTDHYLNGSLFYKVENHLPIGATVKLFLDPDSTRLNADSAYLTITVLDIAPGFVDSTTGLVNEATISGYHEISLDSEQIKILENELVYIDTEIILAGSDNKTVSLSSNDYISIIARIEVEARVDDNF